MSSRWHLLSVDGFDYNTAGFAAVGTGRLVYVLGFGSIGPFVCGGVPGGFREYSPQRETFPPPEQSDFHILRE